MMTALQPLKEGDGVTFVRETFEQAAWSPKVGDRGVVKEIIRDGWLSVKFESRAGHYGFRRNELRKLPVRREV